MPAWKIGTSIPNSVQTEVWSRVIRASLYIRNGAMAAANCKVLTPRALNHLMNRILSRVRQRLGLRTTVRRRGLWAPKARIRIEFGDFGSPNGFSRPVADRKGLTPSLAVCYVGGRFWGAAHQRASSDS
ncbi:MAG: hypothetical protein PVS2B1_12970 [Candidatus Dormibacteraceae bacterium]